MWALAAHYRVTRDRDWLSEGPGSPLQTMLDAFDWVSVQRRRTMREENGERVAHWGLLPPASAHDWLAGSTIFNDAFCIYGMAEVVRMLAEIDHPRAAEMQRELNDYRECLRRNYAAARDRARPLPLADGRAIPYVPRVIQELNWERIDWTYSGYGPLRAGPSARWIRTIRWSISRSPSWKRASPAARCRRWAHRPVHSSARPISRTSLT